MTDTSRPLVPLFGEPWVFGPGDLDGLEAFFRAHGFAILRGLFDEAYVDAMELECATAQQGVVDGTLDDRHGTTIFVDDPDGTKTGRFANDVVTELMRRWLGPGCWTDPERFGTVYQDARAGRESSYTRIGWHSDWQSGPNLGVWPSVAYTFHIDGTSPDNGFLRVVPGSHRWATPAPFENVNGAVVPDGSRPAMGHTDVPPPVPMPLRFEKVQGEIAVYAERGDVIFHDAYVWHSAARATSDCGVRRHFRGGFYGGERYGSARYDKFVKNAAR